MGNKISDRIRRLRAGAATIVAIPTIVFVFWVYLDAREKAGRPVDLELAARDLTLALVLAAAYAVAGAIWHQVRAERNLAPKFLIVQTPLALAAAIAGLTAAILAVTHGPRVLGDYAYFCSLAVAVTAYFTVHLGFGLFLLRTIPFSEVRFTKLETVVLAWLLGEGLAGIVLFSFSVLGVRPWLVAVATLVVMALAARRELGRIGARLFRPVRSSRQSWQWEALWWGAFGAVAVGVFFLNYSRVASLPWMSDEISVHLATVKAYAVAGKMPFLGQIRGSFLYPLMQCMFLPLWYISAELGPRLLEAVFWIASGLLTYALALRAGVGAQGARLATLLLIAMPMMTVLAGVCFLGLPSMVFSLATLLVALQVLRRSPTSRRRRRGLAILLGIFLAFLYWVKMQAWGTVMPVALVVSIALLSRKISLSQAARGFGTTCLVVAALAAPHLVRNELAIGNPVFPLLRSSLGDNADLLNEADIRSLEQVLKQPGMGRTFVDFVKLPARLVLNEQEFRGGRWFGLGSIWLLAFFFSAMGFGRKNWWALAFILSCAVPWFLISQEIRYLIYVFPFVAVMAVCGVERLWGERQGVVGLGALLILASWSLHDPGRDLGFDNLGIRGAGRERFIAERLPAQRAAEWLNRSTEPGTLIYHVGVANIRLLLDDPATLLGDWFGKYRSSRVVERSGGGLEFRPADEVVSALREFGVSYLLINTRRTVDFESLLLKNEFELQQYLSPPRNFAGVLVYEFDPNGRFEKSSEALQQTSLQLIRRPWEKIRGRPVIDPGGGRITLHPGDSVRLGMRASRVPAEAIYSIQALALSSPSRVRLQAVWLPEGGWQARDAEGNPLRFIEISHQMIGVEKERLGTLINRSESAKQLVLTLVNEGTAEVVVHEVTVKSLR